MVNICKLSLQLIALWEGACSTDINSTYSNSKGSLGLGVHTGCPNAQSLLAGLFGMPCLARPPGHEQKNGRFQPSRRSLGGQLTTARMPPALPGPVIYMERKGSFGRRRADNLRRLPLIPSVRIMKPQLGLSLNCPRCPPALPAFTILLFDQSCVRVYLYLLHSEHQGAHSTSKMRPFVQG